MKSQIRRSRVESRLLSLDLRNERFGSAKIAVNFAVSGGYFLMRCFWCQVWSGLRGRCSWFFRVLRMLASLYNGFEVMAKE
jgi:hypothetical protein